MNVEQETLGFRRGSLSLPLSLLMSAFALLIPPASLTRHLRRPTERSPTMSEDRRQRTEDRFKPVLYRYFFCYFQFFANPCSILAISWYSSRQDCHWGCSI